MKTSFPKEIVENCKPVLNKIVTAQEQCIKYTFEAPLIIEKHE